MVMVQTIIHAPIEKVWNSWTTTDNIVEWNFASDDWQCPTAENDLRSGGIFKYRMEAKDGSFGFDFSGVYDLVNDNELIEYTLDDGRKVKVDFTAMIDKTEIIETFEAENINSIKIQHDGWQSILDNFKKLVEHNTKKTVV